MVAAVIVLAVGCSSSKGSDQASSSTETTIVSDTALDGVDTATTDTTEAPPEHAAGGGDAVAFCKAFGEIQDIGNTVSTVNLQTDTLTLLAVRAQSQTVAQQLRDSAPGEIADSANAYADLVAAAGQALGSVTNLRQLGDAVKSLSDARNSDAVTNTILWVTKNCTAPDAAP